MLHMLYQMCQLLRQGAMWDDALAWWQFFDTQNFLGLANYFCKFVMGYAQLASLQQLTKKDKDYACTQKFLHVMLAFRHSP